MKRDEFLSQLGISFVAVCAGSCLAACGKGDTGTPSTGGGTVTPPKPPTNVGFTVDLNTELRNVGDSKVSNGVIVVRTAAGNSVSSFTAVQVACTHEGSSIGYSANQGKFVCPNHGSEFSNSGSVITGPATASLKTYAIAISGTTLSVSG
ncbi:MAG: Rieske 2Fe-2S protein [Sphingobacteriaceae bacterium]|jgi:Rieske Fe-S protein|nr:Rieske 2Fe-2S protein [Sphingobacteriaceae bacterium]